jgi:hypothetical protein
MGLMGRSDMSNQLAHDETMTTTTTTTKAAFALVFARRRT